MKRHLILQNAPTLDNFKKYPGLSSETFQNSMRDSDFFGSLTSGVTIVSKLTQTARAYHVFIMIIIWTVRAKI